VALALHQETEPVSLKSISERCGLSEAYILQIFLVLRRAGIVTSTRGAQGGYMLSRDPSQINAGEVLVALEGPLVPVSCIEESCVTSCDRWERCATRLLWERIAHKIRNLTESITLEDLVRSYYDINRNVGRLMDYSI